MYEYEDRRDITDNFIRICMSFMKKLLQVLLEILVMYYTCKVHEIISDKRENQRGPCEITYYKLLIILNYS